MIRKLRVLTQGEVRDHKMPKHRQGLTVTERKDALQTQPRGGVFREELHAVPLRVSESRPWWGRSLG